MPDDQIKMALMTLVLALTGAGVLSLVALQAPDLIPALSLSLAGLGILLVILKL
ncbi:hypothetical protein [Streptomyces longisporoflavus]|uniref:Uncharacterized protein n=1 Tax=Streptomyces longisporoflavus TaxID=28044 RepID=A0ABW7R4E5_9ACTN